MGHIGQLTSDPVLDAAYAWLLRAATGLSRARRHLGIPAPLARGETPDTQQDLLAGRYTISLLERITRLDGEDLFLGLGVRKLV